MLSVSVRGISKNAPISLVEFWAVSTIALLTNLIIFRVTWFEVDVTVDLEITLNGTSIILVISLFVETTLDSSSVLVPAKITTSVGSFLFSILTLLIVWIIAVISLEKEISWFWPTEIISIKVPSIRAASAETILV